MFRKKKAKRNPILDVMKPRQKQPKKNWRKATVLVTVGSAIVAGLTSKKKAQP